MGFQTNECNPLTKTVAERKRVFWGFFLAGILLVSGGVFSLRTEKTISATGVVKAKEEVTVFAPSDGLLDGPFVQTGERVQAGAALFSLKANDFDLRILERKRQLLEVRNERATIDYVLAEAERRPGDLEERTAQARLDEMQRIARETGEGGRNDVLVASLFLLEREELARRSNRLAELESVLEKETALLEQARRGLRVTASIPGTVVDIYKRDSGQALREGDAVLKICNIEEGYRVAARVSQQDVDQLRKGVAVRMESAVFDSRFEGYIAGRVEGIAPASVGENPEEPRYEVTVAIEKTPHPLVLGSQMTVNFQLGRHSLLSLFMNRPDEPRPLAGVSERTR